MSRIEDLRCKEVINISDGSRLGFVCDVELDTVSGRVLALVIPGKCRFFGLFGRQDDYVIPWNCVRRFGEDIILVEVFPEQVRMPREKRSWF